MDRVLRFVTLTACLFCALGVRAQGTAAIQNHCYLGGTQAKTSGLSSTNYLNGIIPSCTVTVFLTGTQTKATIFSDASGMTLANPFHGNAAGSVDPGGWIFWAAINTGYDIVMSGGIAPNTYAQPVTLVDRFPSFSFQGGASIPNTTETLSGDGHGNVVGMPEKPNTITAGQAFVASDADRANGRLDCRDPSYDGGCLGPTPGLAMQDLRNDIICYQSITGKHANVNLPPGNWRVGTPSSPTLALPTGAYYRGASGNYNATATILQATYNNVLAVHFAQNLTATCPDAQVHTSTLTAGRYEGFGENGCENVSCSNVPGDTSTQVFGGPHQDSIKIEDSQGFVGLIGASNNGGNGVEVGGQDTHVESTIWGFGNMAWYAFGHTQPGQAYNPTTDGWHCNVMLTGLDDTNKATTETYGFLQTPGAEYLHTCGTYWGGGNTSLGDVFSNRDQTCLVRDTGFSNGRVLGGRCDGPTGEAIYNAGSVNTFTSIENTTACSGFSTTPKGTVFGPYIATLGTGMTDSTYVVPATGGAGTGATLTVVVSGGKASTITVSAAGSGYTTTPTFTMTGTGGTPATIGATTYQHCDYLDDEGTFGANSYVNVRNDYLAFFGPDNSTGRIWSASPFNTYDRGTTGEFERQAVGSVINTSKGVAQHKDVLDAFEPSGGVGVTGPAVNFTGGNHFVSSDTSATNWSGPFTVSNIMQDLWITGGGGGVNTTLRVQDGWQTCSGHDINLGAVRQYHFLVYRDDINFTVGTDFLFVEQCDSIFEDYLQPGFAWLAANSALPTTDTQATLDIAGSAAVRPYPALAAMTITSAGGGSGFTYCYATQIWVAGGKQTTAVNCSNTHTPPVTTTGLDNVQVHLALPQNWTRYKVYLNSTTDGSFTPGVWYDVTAANSLPQPASSDFGGGISGLFITKRVPSDTTTIATANLALNMTGTYNVSLGGVAVPATSATLCVPGQVIRSVSGGFDYVCDAEDHWKRAAVTWANF